MNQRPRPEQSKRRALLMGVGNPRFPDWLEKKDPKLLLQLEDYLIEFGIEITHEAADNAAKRLGRLEEERQSRAESRNQPDVSISSNPQGDHRP